MGTIKDKEDIKGILAKLKEMIEISMGGLIIVILIAYIWGSAITYVLIKANNNKN